MTKRLTLLLTDVVDSTLLNTRVGDAVMGPLWAAHDRESRALMQQWRAREVSRSDGFLLLFDAPIDALGFAHEYHRALARLSVRLRARVGIHTGPVELRRNSPQDVERGAPLFEVDGLALPLAARLMAAASPGQTLLSADCRAALEPGLNMDCLVIGPPSRAGPSATSGGQGEPSDSHVRLRLVCQGHWRFKGLDAPVQVFQAGTEQDDFTPASDSAKGYRVLPVGDEWLPVRDVPHKLPAERDPFIGRIADLRNIAQRFEDGARVVSLLGIGGIGKTRASVRFARGWLGDFAGGAWFCDLSAAQGLDGIVYATAQALDVSMDKTDPVEIIGAAIAGRGACLVILDNFEQVARHAEATLGAWLQRAPEARFLVTTRELLGIPGEHAVLLEPLDRQEAEELLRERMSAAGLSAELAAVDAAAVGPLVDLLDRLPLAIELAAARARVMRPAELLARMGERFKLLAARRGRHDRQATLRTTLDWSWERLSAAEQAALAQCSVFEGGFTLPAAEAVLDLAGAEEDPWVVDVVQALVEKSLLRQSQSYRFDMLRCVHEYAAERLTNSATQLQRDAVARHWRYFASLSEQAAIADRCIEAENLVAACRRAIAAADLVAAADALLAAWATLNLTGPFNVAIEMAQDLYRAAHPHAMPSAMTARWVCGSARYLAGDVAAAQADLEAAIWPDGGPKHQARALGALGQLERSLGHLDRAEDLLESALHAARETGDPGLICRAYNALGTLRLAQGQLAAAHQHFTAGLETARSADDLKQQAALLGNIGVVERKRGNDPSALRHYGEALLLAQQIGDRRFEGNMRSNLGLFHFQSGDCKSALSELRAALDIAQSAGLTRLSANVSCNLGLVQESLGEREAALDRHRKALQMADGLRDVQLSGHFRIYLGRLLVRMHCVPEARVCLDEAQAQLARCVDGGVLGLLACAWAECAAAAGENESSLSWLRTARQYAEESAGGANSELLLELRQVQELINSR